MSRFFDFHRVNLFLYYYIITFFSHTVAKLVLEVGCFVPLPIKYINWLSVNNEKNHISTSTRNNIYIVQIQGSKSLKSLKSSLVLELLLLLPDSLYSCFDLSLSEGPDISLCSKFDGSDKTRQ